MEGRWSDNQRRCEQGEGNRNRQSWLSGWTTGVNLCFPLSLSDLLRAYLLWFRRARPGETELVMTGLTRPSVESFVVL